MLKKLRSESGAYSIEATISLMALVIAVAFVYTQVRVIICESIMQHAVDNMAMEVSSYVYILDKLGIVIHPDGTELESANAAAQQGKQFIDTAKETRDSLSQKFDNYSQILTSITGDKAPTINIDEAANQITTDINDIKGAGDSMVTSIKAIIEIAKKGDWKTEATQAGVIVADSAVTVLADKYMSEFYDWKLSAYLPMDKESFYKSYYIEPDSVSFSKSKVFPGTKNNTILVCVEYTTKPVFSWFPVRRKIVKQAYTAAWLADPANGLQPS
ncbi:MAG: hypothetical protein ACI4Q4_03535 [Oscillospiraceae bacterium]